MTDWWVYIERDQGAQDVAVGPYPSEGAAALAGEASVLVEYLLSPAGGGGTDCYWSADQPTAEHEQHIIDPDDPHHTGGKEIRIMPSVMHVDDGKYDEAHARMTRLGRGERAGYTRAQSGWQMYSGLRLVEVTTCDEHNTTVSVEMVEHAQIMRVLQDHLNEIGRAHGNPVDDLEYDVTDAALSLVLSDAETGTSILAWPVMNRLVDRALTAAMLGDEPGSYVTTEWEEF